MIAKNIFLPDFFGKFQNSPYNCFGYSEDIVL